jgi:hypothetical protein
MAKFGPIGIDFGTTKTRLAYSNQEGGRSRIIAQFPTAISIEKGQTLIGDDAVKDSRGWKKFKLHMGKKELPIECREAPLDPGTDAPSPIHLASIVFRELRRRFLKEISSDDQTVGPVTITVPSESTFRHRQAVIYSATIAGFTDISIIEEPVAAYLMHYSERLSVLKKPIKALVIDFGGGTCDLTVIQSQPGKIPVVIGSRTINKGGNDIDDEIVRLWTDEKRFEQPLPNTNGLYSSQITLELKNAAQFRKYQCNPIPEFGKIAECLANPLSTQYISPKSHESPYSYLVDDIQVDPPILTPADFKVIMPMFTEAILKEIDYLLPTEEARKDIVKIIFAGGSCYIRQVLETIRQLFNHLNPEENFLFEEPEKAIAYGAVEYQRLRMSGQRPIENRLQMSTYLQLDYDHREDLSAAQMELSKNKFISHQDKSLIQLAAKGLPLKKQLKVNDPLWKSKPMFIPLPVGRRDANWKIYQVRSSSPGEDDYKIIDEQTEPIDSISFRVNWFDRIVPVLAVVRLSYAFDIYGDFYRAIREYLSFHVSSSNLSYKNEDLNWRNSEKIAQKRADFFSEGGEL